MSRIHIFTSCSEADRAQMQAARAANEFFWLDLHAPSASDLAITGELSDWHPLVIEDLEHRGQRPKVEEFADYVFVVAMAAAYVGEPAELELHEFALIVHGNYLVTIGYDAPGYFERLRELVSQREQLGASALLHRVLDRIVDVNVATSEGLGTYVQQLEIAMDEGTSDELLLELRARRRELVRSRSVVVAQRDALESLSVVLDQLAGFEHSMHDHFRDVVDHARRVVDDLEVARILLDDAFEAYYTMLVAHQGRVAQRLTVVATIFLPLTFVTGFFGQNFEWMIVQVAGRSEFLVFGLGTSLVTAVGLVLLFRRLHWW